jgi:hypothetical protein
MTWTRRFPSTRANRSANPCPVCGPGRPGPNFTVLVRCGSLSGGCLAVDPLDHHEGAHPRDHHSFAHLSSARQHRLFDGVRRVNFHPTPETRSGSWYNHHSSRNRRKRSNASRGTENSAIEYSSRAPRRATLISRSAPAFRRVEIGRYPLAPEVTTIGVKSKPDRGRPLHFSVNGVMLGAVHFIRVPRRSDQSEPIKSEGMRKPCSQGCSG